MWFLKARDKFAPKLICSGNHSLTQDWVIFYPFTETNYCQNTMPITLNCVRCEFYSNIDTPTLKETLWFICLVKYDLILKVIFFDKTQCAGMNQPNILTFKVKTTNNQIQSTHK